MTTTVVTPPADEADAASFRSALTRFLAAALQAPELRLIDHRRSGGGHSWETYLVTVEAPGLTPRRLAVKRQPSVGMPGLGDYDVQREIDLFRLGRAAGVPVPDVVGCDPEPADGRGFYVTTFVEGLVPTPHDLARTVPDLADRRALGLELARIMARLHQHPIEQVPASIGGLDVSGESAGRLAMERWRSTYREGSPLRIPMLDLAFAWLDHRSDDVTGHLRLIHNDLHVGNFICSGARVAAVLDWETAELSDPAGDIAKFNLPTWQGGSGLASGLLPLPDFIEEYVAHGGPRPSTESLRYWTVLSLTKSATIMLTSAKQYADGRHRDIRWGNLGYRLIVHLRFLMDLLESGEWGQP